MVASEKVPGRTSFSHFGRHHEKTLFSIVNGKKVTMNQTIDVIDPFEFAWWRRLVDFTDNRIDRNTYHSERVLRTVIGTLPAS